MFRQQCRVIFLEHHFFEHETSCSLAQPPPVSKGKSKEEEKRIREEQIRCESDLKRIYLYASRAIQTQDQTNLNRYALVKGKFTLDP